MKCLEARAISGIEHLSAQTASAAEALAKTAATYVELVLQTMLASRAWTAPQRELLKKLAAQSRANLLVDSTALDAPVLISSGSGAE